LSRTLGTSGKMVTLRDHPRFQALLGKCRLGRCGPAGGGDVPGRSLLDFSLTQPA
jgi:hypothetical protein